MTGKVYIWWNVGAKKWAVKDDSGLTLVDYWDVTGRVTTETVFQGHSPPDKGPAAWIVVEGDVMVR